MLVNVLSTSCLIVSDFDFLCFMSTVFLITYEGKNAQVLHMPKPQHCNKVEVWSEKKHIFMVYSLFVSVIQAESMDFSTLKLKYTNSLDLLECQMWWFRLWTSREARTKPDPSGK